VKARESADQVATRALAAAKEVEKDADVRASVEHLTSANVRFANNEITTSGESTEVTVSLWMARGRRHASASTNQTDTASLRALADRAASLVRVAPDDPERMPLLPPETYPTAASAYDDALASMSPVDRAAIAGRAIRRGEAAGVVMAGFFERSAFARALRTSSGLVAGHRATRASYTVTARTRDGRGSGWAGRETHRQGGIDDVALAARAVDKAVRSAAGRPLEPGKYTVILEPQAVMELLSFLVSAMDARAADEGRSYFAGKVGSKPFADLVSLTSDPTDPRTPGAPFDAEGLALASQRWIVQGRVNELFVSRYWAAKRGTRPTGQHRVFRLEGGAAASVDDLVRGTKRGLLVTRLWYTRMLEPQTVTLTGLTRDGVFLIEDGRVTGPVGNFRYNESPITVLRNVDGLTAEAVRVPSWGGAAWHVPALRTHEFTMASPSAAV
jgi:predicted Zn-dependent protease